jgi:hypothetical protein
VSRLAHPAKTARQAAYWRRHGRPDIAQTLEAALAAAGRCRRCGRTLTDPVSVEAGEGPECRAKPS